MCVILLVFKTQSYWSLTLWARWLGANITIEIVHYNSESGKLCPISSVLLLDFINKVLLGHRHTYWLCLACGCLGTTTTEISSYDPRSCGLQHLRFYSLAFCKFVDFWHKPCTFPQKIKDQKAKTQGQSSPSHLFAADFARCLEGEKALRPLALPGCVGCSGIAVCFCLAVGRRLGQVLGIGMQEKEKQWKAEMVGGDWREGRETHLLTFSIFFNSVVHLWKDFSPNDCTEKVLIKYSLKFHLA